MKHIIIFFVALSLFACNTKRSAIKDFIPGVYANKGETKLSKAVVYLKITKVDGNVYTVEYRRSFQQKINGEWLTAQVETTNIPMTFNVSTNQLEDPIKNKVITFFPDNNTLMLNQAVYTKIK